jgi:hypothetical protein
VKKEVCNIPQGCEIREGVCIGCIIEKVWE